LEPTLYIRREECILDAPAKSQAAIASRWGTFGL